MADKKNSINPNIDKTNSPELLSDETIDELGYARFTATSIVPLTTTQPTTLSAMVVTGPTKSPPPVLMPRPRPAIHPTLKLTNAFANHEPVLSPTPSPSASLQDEYPDQPPSTYLTPPTAPILKPVTTPIPGGLSGLPSTAQQQQQQQINEEMPLQRQSLSSEMESSITSSSSPTQHIISASSIGDNSNLNHHQISSKTCMATQPQSIQLEEQGARQNQHPCTAATVSTNDDDVRPHVGVLARKMGGITLTASTSAPLVPSPLVKSTLASQLSSSSSSSSGSEQQQKQQKQQRENEIQQQDRSQQDQKEQQHRQQRRLRKSLSTEQLPKSGRSDFQHSDSSIQHQHYQLSQHVPLPGGNRPSTVEKLIYSGGGKSTLQQLQQEYLLRQNGYLLRQVDALKFDNMESQRQQQELATRMKQLEIQLLEEKKRQTPPHQQSRMQEAPTANEYQHHHYYHHNVFAPLPPHIDNYQNSDEDEGQDVKLGDDDARERGADNETTTTKRSDNQNLETLDANNQQQQQQSHNRFGKSMDENLPVDKHYMDRHHEFLSTNTNIAVAKKPQQQPTNQQKRPLMNQRRHSSHIAPIPPTSDSILSATEQPRRRHVTAPSISHHYRDRSDPGQKNQRGSNHQRSRSLPKNDHLHPSPHSYWRQQQGDRAYRGRPIYFDDNNDNSPRHHHHRSMLPPPLQQQLEETMDMESDEDLDMAPGTGFENEDEYYYDDDDNDEEDYLDELDYYRYHMTTAPGPPMNYYPPPPPPPPETFFNDPYGAIPMGPHLPAPPLPLHRRKSASALRASRAGPQGFMDVMNSDHYERPLRLPPRRNWNNPQSNQLRQMHMTPPSPRRPQQYHHERRGYRIDPASYGPRQHGHPPPPTTTTMSTAPPPPRPGTTVDHVSRKVSTMTSPRMTTLPLRRPIVTRGSAIGSYPGRV